MGNITGSDVTWFSGDVIMLQETPIDEQASEKARERGNEFFKKGECSLVYMCRRRSGRRYRHGACDTGKPGYRAFARYVVTTGNDQQ